MSHSIETMIAAIMHKLLHSTIRKLKYIFFALILFIFLIIFGAFTHIFEKHFDKFEYPLNVNIMPYIEQLKNKEVPSISPINAYNYTFVKTAKEKCIGANQPRLVILVKSAMNNFHRREVIRNTFGYERRFSDVTIKTVFLLGMQRTNILNDVQMAVDLEHNNYKDIVQSSFIDSYFNNTIKTMMGIKWVMTYCAKSKFYLFVDDDMYVSIKNALRFIRNPSYYPKYVEEYLRVFKKPVNAVMNSNQLPNKDGLKRTKRQVADIYELPDDAILYAGYMFSSAPHRHWTSKWYISLKEYPYHMWPPYISAGAYILSREALITMYYASYYTAHFRFDDIYLGILAKKSEISPFHCDEFYFYKKPYNVESYRYVVASHGYDNPSELLKIWNEQRAAGNA